MISITGKITDATTGVGIPFASIAVGLLDGSDWFAIGTGTTTDFQGNYSLSYVPGGSSNERLQIRHVSYNPEFIDPELDSANVSLTPATYQVPEVVVDGGTVWVDAPDPFESRLLFFVVVAVSFLALFVYAVNGANGEYKSA